MSRRPSSSSNPSVGVFQRILTLTPWTPPGVRQILARAAARRGLGATALAAEPEDAEIFALLGMYESAAKASAPFPRIIGLAGCGRTDEARAEAAGMTLNLRQRRLLASVAAAFDPSWALELLPPEAAAARAACQIAVGQIPDFASTDRSLEGILTTVAVLAQTAKYNQARERLNAFFSIQGLEPPVPMSNDALSLDDFSAEAPAIEDGPLVSIIVPFRDAHATLEFMLRSLSRQSWRRLEVLLVDDGSTDQGPLAVQHYARRDNRVRLLSNQRSQGAYGARNTGIAAAKGDIIAFHDADDWAHPRRIERQVQALGAAQGSVCRYFRLDDRGRVVNPRTFPLLRTNPIHLMIPRAILDRLGPFEEVVTGGDSELLARVETRLGRWRVARLPDCLVVARWSSSSLMGAASTGLAPEGLARRIAYVEDWRRRHAELARDRLAWIGRR